jgi:Flp pilus assembly protein TadB
VRYLKEKLENRETWKNRRKKGKISSEEKMKKCNTNPIIKYFRIFFSLTVIILGIIYKTWLGVLGVFTLISAFTGGCPLSFNFRRSINYKREEEE